MREAPNDLSRGAYPALPFSPSLEERGSYTNFEKDMTKSRDLTKGYGSGQPFRLPCSTFRNSSWCYERPNIV